jgi:hypothetical protein
MKKARIRALLTALIIFALFSCDDQLLTSPNVPGGGDGVSGGRSAAPDGIRASHGEKGSITISWNANSNAALYYVYKAVSPLDTFDRCAETSNVQLTLPVPAGTTAYYRVSFVSRNGKESSHSMYVKGTSLAQPVISDITDKDEASATVTWYMDNAFDDTYKSNLLYTVYCFIKGGAEVAQIALDGSTLAENKTTCSNLSAKTDYEFQVEAYLRSDQSASEKSEKVNAATARRMRPGAAEDLYAARGASASEIELSFKLPDMVDIALGDDQFAPKPVYFKIFKRPYSASGNNEYQEACPYFGSNASSPFNLGTLGKTFASYSQGATVTWTDNKVSRGVEYEYQVQSYVDETQKVITSDSSKTSAKGWALSEGTLSFGKVAYTFNDGGDLYASARLPLVFDLDHKDVTYSYSLIETIDPIDDWDGEGENKDPDNTVKRNIDNLNYSAIKNYIAQMNLTQKTTHSSPGRGLYSYAVEITLDGNIIDTVSTIGEVEVSEHTDPIVVDDFHVQDGYKDRFKFKWPRYGNRGYIIYMSGTGVKDTYEEITRVLPTDNADNDSTSFVENFYLDYQVGITTGMTKYFAIRPFRTISDGSTKSGQMVYATSERNAGFKTLGVPVLELSAEPSYSVITAVWDEAQKADTYRIKYWYAGEGSYGTPAGTKTIAKSALTVVDASRLKYSFTPFTTIEVSKAGKQILVAVDALNEGLAATASLGEISTTSAAQPGIRLVGPAELNPSASKAASPQEIDVSWNEISGASGYYVFRRQFSMNNSVEESGHIAYYVPAVKTSITVVGKELALSNNEKVDTNSVKATASFTGSRYTLKDLCLPDLEYDGSYANYFKAYRDQQNDMAQGFSYRYYIVPVVKSDDYNKIEFRYNRDGTTNKNTNIDYYTINENSLIRYNGAAALEQEGFVIGFGQDVTATKGTYASSGNLNNGVLITWSLPAKLAGVAGFSPRYSVYRKANGSTQWDTITTNQTVLQYPDIPPTRGITYEYVVGIANGSGAGSAPKDSYRYINLCGTLLDEKKRPKFLGYMLGYVRLNSVSRDARTRDGQFAELLGWQSAGISNSFSSEYNWGIDGYTIFLLNRNVNNLRQWITGDDVPVSGLPNQTNQEYLFANNADNRLKVLRDYRHYFKVRPYVLNSLNEKVYGPDPASEYLIADGRNDEYVKWGARQISTDEFAAITSLSIGTALNWWANPGEVPDRNWNGGHNVSVGNNNLLGYQCNMDFNNSKPYFVNISGRLHGRVIALPRSPEEYGAYGTGTSGLAGSAQNQQSTLNFTGPSDVSMYSGTVTILRMTSSSGAGNAYRVTYNGQNSIAVDPKHYRNNFTFNAGNKNDFKRTRNHDWSSSAGITGTGNVGPNMNDKWWYPINGNNAGWD